MSIQLSQKVVKWPVLLLAGFVDRACVVRYLFIFSSPFFSFVGKRKREGNKEKEGRERKKDEKREERCFHLETSRDHERPVEKSNYSKKQHDTYAPGTSLTMSLSFDPLEQIDTWFQQMVELREKNGRNYSQLTRQLIIKPPVRKVCQLLGVNTLAEICTEDLLYRTIVRVAQMQIEEKELAESEAEVLDIYTSLKPAPSLGDTILSIPPPPFPTIISNIIQRPANLTALLDLVNKSGTTGKNKFITFISLADESQVEITKSGVLHIAPKFMATDAKPEKHVTTTSAIREIFEKYCILKTFKEKVETRGTPEMTLKSVMAFCRDFDLYPKLLTKEEIRLVLSVMDVRNARKGLKKLKGALEFTSFMDFLVRIALFAYNKPTTKAFILKLNNERMPSKLEMVDYLCQYLHFDDIKWVRERLQSTDMGGVALCGFGNDENHKPTKKISKHVLQSATPRKDVVQGHYEAVDIKSMPFLLERERQNKSLEGIKTKPRLKPFPSQVESLFFKHAERVRAEAAEEEDDREEHISVSNKSGQGGGASLQGSVVAGEKSRPGSVVGSGSVTGLPNTSNHKTPPFALDLTNLALSKSGKGNVDWNLANDATGTVNVTEEQRMLINGELDLALRQSMERYSQQKDMKPSSTLWHSSNGCFMDMGRLTKGSEIEIQLVVTNCSSDHIYLDTTCKGFDAPDTRVVTKPCSVAPGLSRTVSILFTVQPGDRATVGSIQVFVASVRTGIGHVFDVPSHYRVGPPHPETDGFLCTLNNIDILKRRYLDGTENDGGWGTTNVPSRHMTETYVRVIDPIATRLIRPFDTHRTNQQVKERTNMYDITKFPKISDGISGTGTYSTLFSNRFQEM